MEVLCVGGDSEAWDVDANEILCNVYQWRSIARDEFDQQFDLGGDYHSLMNPVYGPES